MSPAEPVKHHQPGLLMGPALEGDVEAVGPLVPLKPHLGVLSLKGDRDDPL